MKQNILVVAPNQQRAEVVAKRLLDLVPSTRTKRNVVQLLNGTTVSFIGAGQSTLGQSFDLIFVSSTSEWDLGDLGDYLDVLSTRIHHPRSETRVKNLDSIDDLLKYL